MSFTTSQQKPPLNPHELFLRMWDDKQQLLGGHNRKKKPLDCEELYYKKLWIEKTLVLQKNKCSNFFQLENPLWLVLHSGNLSNGK